MTLMAAAARRRSGAGGLVLPDATEAAPYGAITVCTLPAYTNGNLNTVHPSVHDFGMKWHGYRWWMANTPYPPDADENPCIFGSNDMVTWVTPAGLTNPIDPFPGAQKYNSDTELVIDDSGAMVCIYREYDGATGADIILARVSPDGVTWGPEHTIFSPPAALGRLGVSPAVIRYGPGDFRMWIMGPSGMAYLKAPEPLGPWSLEANITGIANSYHGDIIKYGAVLLGALTDATSAYCGHSTDGGLTWTFDTSPTITGGAYGVYRATLAPSPKAGWIDVWHGGHNGSNVWRTCYTRVPLSAFGV